MESQPQNPEFRINHENFHPCMYGGRKCSNNFGLAFLIHMATGPGLVEQKIILS